MEHESNFAKLRAPAAVLAAFLITACRAYPDPKPEDPVPHDAAIGFEQQLERHDARAFRVLLVHGMGTHDVDFADGWVVNGIAARLHLTPVERKSYVVDVAMGGLRPDDQPKLTIYNYIGRDELHQRDVDFRFVALTWSPLTTGYKKRLLTGEDQATRAYLNEWLKKELLDEAIADAILYVGKYRPFIRQAATTAICQALARDPKQPCDWSGIDTSETRLDFVTHSLGSRIVDDALIELIESNPTAQQKLLPALNYGASFFMFANQLPLLRLGDEDQQPPRFGQGTSTKMVGVRGLGLALRQARAARGEIAAPPINVVAFSDPNDVLSYRVPLGDDYSVHGALRFINVRISNGPTWLGVVESPFKAHQGYQTNDAVWDVVTRGLP